MTMRKLTRMLEDMQNMGFGYEKKERMRGW
jgi:hypothetical protein